MITLDFIISAIVGFATAKIFSGKKEGKQGRIKPLQFQTKKYTTHIHHWLLGTIILGILLIFNYYNEIIFGFILGIILQGLTYKDFYKIIYKKIK